MEPSLTFRRGEEIDQREAGVAILKKYWKAFAPQDASEWSRRISNAGSYIVAAYVGNVIAAILEAMRLDTAGDPNRVPATFDALTAGGTWKTHRESGDTVMLVDLTVGSEYRRAGLFDAFALYARKTFASPSRVIFTYSPLFSCDMRYRVVTKHERLGAILTRELSRSRPGLTMAFGGEDVIAEDVGIAAYKLP